jgi:hypothetical protein
MTRLKINDLALWPSYFLRTCTLETRAVSVHRPWWPLDFDARRGRFDDGLRLKSSGPDERISRGHS